MRDNLDCLSVLVLSKRDMKFIEMLLIGLCMDVPDLRFRLRSHCDLCSKILSKLGVSDCKRMIMKRRDEP